MTKQLMYEIAMNDAEPETLGGFIIQRYRLPIEEQLKQQFLPCLIVETIYSARENAFRNRVVLRQEFLGIGEGAVDQKNYLVNINNGQSNFESGHVVEAVSELSDTQQCSQYLHFLGLVQTNQKVWRGFIIRGKQITVQLARQIFLPESGSVERLNLTSGILSEQLQLDDTKGSKLELKFVLNDPQADEQLKKIIKILRLPEPK